MELFEYIKSQLPQMPNSAIMKQMGASEELIDYVKETPWNTNWNVIGSITGSGGGGEAEVWLVGDTGTEAQGTIQFVLSNISDINHMSELLTNGENYKVYLNGNELPYLSSDSFGRDWFDGNVEESITKGVSVFDNDGTVMATAYYIDASTAPSSVEVSVKAK